MFWPWLALQLVIVDGKTFQKVAGPVLRPATHTRALASRR